MTTNELAALKPGDKIKGRITGMVYIVTGNYGGHITAVRTVDVTNAPEWEKVDELPTMWSRDASPRRGA